jgi:NADPH-dependent 2,4-dienoyl-CoA reductase/sulfur reductase-like enzyme
VLVAAGAVPAAELIGDLAAARGGGIATDACGRTRAPGVYAAGDVAAPWQSSLGTHLRVEHWTAAAGQATAAGRAILGHEAPYVDPPYFWSDQFGLRLQQVGHPAEATCVEIDGSPEAFRARYLDADGRLVAALVANRPGEIAALRRLLVEPAAACSTYAVGV